MRTTGWRVKKPSLRLPKVRAFWHVQHSLLLTATTTTAAAGSGAVDDNSDCVADVRVVVRKDGANARSILTAKQCNARDPSVRGQRAGSAWIGSWAVGPQFPRLLHTLESEGSEANGSPCEVSVLLWHCRATGVSVLTGSRQQGLGSVVCILHCVSWLPDLVCHIRCHIIAN